MHPGHLLLAGTTNIGKVWARPSRGQEENVSRGIQAILDVMRRKAPKARSS